MESENKKQKKRLSEQIGKKEKRKLNALRNNKRSVWFGLGMMGMIGWSVAVPTLLGAVLGIWLDRIYPKPFSWTLTFLIVGLFTGCVIAWFWVEKEDKEMHQDKEE